MSNKKETKADATATAQEEATEQQFLAKQAKKPKAQAAEGEIQPREGEEFLPPHDPPVVESPPLPPAAFDAVDASEKGAQPEATALRELELLQVGTRGEGPAPEEPPPPPIP